MSISGEMPMSQENLRVACGPEQEDFLPGYVVVRGWPHDPCCLVARYRQAAEAGGDPDGFPWCTCPDRSAA